MSKERARRRVEREREDALKRSARAADRERRERRQARKRALTKRLPRLAIGRQSGRQSGIIAQRRRKRMTAILCCLLLLQVLVWLVRPDWAARLTALMLSILVFPLLALFVL